MTPTTTTSSSSSKMGVMLVALLLLTVAVPVSGLGEIVYAVNCGGDAHVDGSGIGYAADLLRVGTASDYGKQLIISRVPPSDQILYQTERYHTATFGYDIPVQEDGVYLLVLKFSEVYFNAPGMKVLRGPQVQFSCSC